jgi:hypothetical protein
MGVPILVPLEVDSILPLSFSAILQLLLPRYLNERDLPTYRGSYAKTWLPPSVFVLSEPGFAR